ncbi:MAG: RnfABCDGE type electron transport complex subunit B [Firmicutes bacterium]|nr:RnfABCDGE type electron transport complex subunit B [Bacillota bacterium]
METILITTLVITLIGLVVGVGLVITGRKFHVEVDEKEVAVRAELPGNNCGACGYAGCDAMAAAIAKGEAPVNGCPVGGAPVAAMIASIMGTEAGEIERKVAFVRCKGTCQVTKNQGEFYGVRDCRSVQLNGIRTTECDYGCLGFGSCNAVCPEDAIRVVDGCAVVNPERCVGCGLCVKTCPRGLIELVPYDKKVRVQCSNHDMGPTVKKVCKAGCIGCSLCQRKCPAEAISVTGNLAHVNYDNCIQCLACAEACPVKVITVPEMPKEAGEEVQNG